MKKVCKFIVSIIILLLLGIVLNCNEVQAATATLSNDKTVTQGDSVTVTAKVTAGAWDLTLSGAGKNEQLVGFTSVKGNENDSTSITFTANEVGTYKFTLTGDISDYDTDETSIINKTMTITVKEKKVEENNSGNSSSNSENTTGNTTGGNTIDNSGSESNTNAGSSAGTQEEIKKGTVSSCYINGIKVNKSLNVKNKESITVVVNTSTKEGLKIYNNKTKKTYTAKSGEVTNVQIVEGQQTLTITLDTGNTTTRTITSTIEGEEVEPNVIEEEVKVILKSLSVKGVKADEEKINLELTPEFSDGVYEYTINIPSEHNDITKLDVEAIGDKEEFIVEVTGNEELVDGENIITILVKSKDETRTTTYQIKVNKEEVKTVETVVAPVEEISQVEDNNVSRIFIKNLIIVFTLVIAIAGIIFAIVEYRYTKNNKTKGDFEKVSYVSMKFNKEKNDKEDIIQDLKEDNYKEGKETKGKRAKREKVEEIEDTLEETFEVLHEEEKPKRRGKHF